MSSNDYSFLKGAEDDKLWVDKSKWVKWSGKPDFVFWLKSRRIGVLFKERQGDTFEIMWFGIDPQYRLSGHGREFLKRAEQLAKDQGCIHILAWNVNPKYTSFWEKMNYSKNEEDDQIHYEKHI